MFAELGWTGMFLSSLLAATILPLGSEIVLVALLAAGYNPLMLTLVATIGNVAGALINYVIGRTAGKPGIQRIFKVDDQRYTKAERYYQRYGIWSLCLAWVPVIGDPLTLIAGALRSPLPAFLVLVTLGKGCRYLVLTLMSI